MSAYIKLEDAIQAIGETAYFQEDRQIVEDGARAALEELDAIEVSEDCISRKGVLKKIRSFQNADTTGTDKAIGAVLGAVHCAEIVLNAPSVIPSRPRGEWILCSEKMPEVEKKVWVQTRSGEVTPAMYEDGTVSEADSLQSWYDVEWDEWDEKNGCMIVPKGWWAASDFLPDSEYGYPIDEEVIAWMPPELYRAEGKESQDD